MVCATPLSDEEQEGETQDDQIVDLSRGSKGDKGWDEERLILKRENGGVRCACHDESPSLEYVVRCTVSVYFDVHIFITPKYLSLLPT